MKLHINLPELQRVVALLAASVQRGHDADAELHQRLAARVSAEVASRDGRRHAAILQAADGAPARAAGQRLAARRLEAETARRTQTRYI